MSICRLCEVHVETLDHLWVHCCFSKRLWEFIEECFRCPLNLSSDIANLFSSALKEIEVLSQQVFDLWLAAISFIYWVIQHSQNKIIFYDRKPNLASCKAWLVVAIQVSNSSITEHMYNSQEEQLILHNLGIIGNARRCPSIILAFWNFPRQNWIKVNIDGAAKGAPKHSGVEVFLGTVEVSLKDVSQDVLA